jgi:leader peptidase (prepilin peptidase)/N-methyltransferase
MGFGDVKLMAMIGAFLGWQIVLFVLFFSAFIAIGYGLVRMASTGDNKIPYGPFLSIAAAVGLLFRPAIDDFVAGIIASYGLLF